MGLFSGKCKHWKDCRWFSKDSVTCNKYSGGYYPDGFGLRVAGCYITMEQNKKKEKEKEQNKKNKTKKTKKSIKDLQPFTKYLLVGIAVTILSMFFSWFFIDIIEWKAFWVFSVLAVVIFLFKYHSYTQINLIKKKFVIFMIIEISSLIASVIIGGIFIDILSFPTLIVIPISIVILFLLRFAALHWTKIIKN